MNSLAEVLIIISPVVPHFASECWERLKENLHVDKFKKDKLVIEQDWPEVDSSYLASIKSKKLK